MKLRDLLFALLVISGVVYGFGGLFTSLADTYHVPAPSENLTAFYNIQKVSQIGNSLQNNQTGIGSMLSTIPILGSFAVVMLAGVQLLITMLSIPTIYLNMLTSLMGITGLPQWFIDIAFNALIIYVVFEIIQKTITKGGGV